MWYLWLGWYFILLWYLFPVSTQVYYNNQQHTGPAVLVFCVLVVLHLCLWGTDCCAVMKSLPRCRQCTGVTTRATAAASRAQPNLLLLILPGRVCGCTATAVAGWHVAAVMRRATTACSFETDPTLLWKELLFTLLRWMLVCLKCLTFCVTWPPDWPLCDWQVSKACRRDGASDSLYTPVSSWRHEVSFLHPPDCPDFRHTDLANF